MSKRENIEKAVQAGLCTGCGTCVAICPKEAVNMAETANGLLFAKVNTQLCDACGMCVQVCGGLHLYSDLLFKDTDPFKGEVLAAYCGFSTDPDLRMRGQSGGVATALLAFLLEQGRIDQALVSSMPEDGSLRPQPYLATNLKDLLQSQGSKYCPVALNSAIPKNIGKSSRKLAVVGLPCQVHSIRNAQHVNRYWREGIELIIGLFCDRTLAYCAMQYIIEKANSSKDNILSFRYKDKTKGSFPGPICIYTKDCKEINLPSSERLSIKDYFTPPRCRLCFDKMNILSDISVGDAWGVKEDKDGFSVLTVRTQRGIEIIKEAQTAGVLSLEQIDPENIFKGQGIETRRNQYSAYTNVWRDFNKELPEHGIYSKYIERNNERYEKIARDQYKWSEKFIEGKSSNEIIAAVKRREKIKRIKGNLKWYVYKRWI